MNLQKGDKVLLEVEFVADSAAGTKKFRLLDSQNTFIATDNDIKQISIPNFKVGDKVQWMDQYWRVAMVLAIYPITGKDDPLLWLKEDTSWCPTTKSASEVQRYSN